MELKKLKEVVFYEYTHQYLLNGKKVLKGVTTLLKDHGLSPAEYATIDEKILHDAATRGTAVHKMLEAYDNGEAVVSGDVFNEEGKCLIDAKTLHQSLNAYKKLGLKVFASEWLVSDLECVASSIDKVIETDVDGEFILGDIKTSSTIHKETYGWQLSIYAYLFEHQHPGAKVVGLEVIHVRDGKVKVIPLPRKKDEDIEQLLFCEKFGTVYQADMDDNGMEADLILPQEDLLVYGEKMKFITQLKESLKQAQDEIKSIEDAIYQKMLESNIDSLPIVDGEIKLKRPYDKQSVDSKLLREKYPDIYDECLKTTTAKGNISITFNKQ